MLRTLFCTVALFGFGAVASAGELDKEIGPKVGPPPGLVTAAPSTAAPAAGSEMDRESPQGAYHYHGGWGHGGWGHGGYGYGHRGWYGGYGGYRGWGGYGGYYRPYYSGFYRPYYGGYYGGFGYPYYGGYGYRSVGVSIGFGGGYGGYYW